MQIGNYLRNLILWIVGVAALDDPQFKFAYMFFRVAEGGDPYNICNKLITQTIIFCSN